MESRHPAVLSRLVGVHAICVAPKDAALQAALELPNLEELPAEADDVEQGQVGDTSVQLIGHLYPCMTEIYLHIVARMADSLYTHPPSF